jgi:hypothetical protein
MPAPAMHFPVSAPRLLELLEDWLHKDYGFLLSILPRSLFETRNGNIVINQQCHSEDGLGKSPIYGSFSGESGTLQLCARSTRKETKMDQFASNFSGKDAVLSTLEDRLVAFSQVPPMSWLFTRPPKPGCFETSDWTIYTLALVNYYLLVWAFEEGYSGFVAGPHPDHLRDALDRLKMTPHYEQALFRREDAEFLDVHISRLKDNNTRAKRRALQSNSILNHCCGRSLSTTCDEAQHATALDDEDNVTSVSTIEQILREMSQPLSMEAASGCTTPIMDATADEQEDSQETLSVRSTTLRSLLHRTTLSEPHSTSEQSRQCQLANTGSSPGSSGTDDGSPRIPLFDRHMPETSSTSFSPRATFHLDNTVEAAHFDPPQTSMNTEDNVPSMTSLNKSEYSKPVVDEPIEAVVQPVREVPSGAYVPSDTPASGLDEHLAHLQTKVGHDLLSLLPDLRATMFLKLHSSQARPGYLSIRMLFGKANQSAPPQLRGRNVWIVCKIHEKDARTAPRMLLDALSSDDDELIEENLAFKSTLLWLDLEPVFSIVTEEGLKREHQLKAVAKYYFILAANAKLHGFEQHLMPANDTFVEQMRTVCRRIQNSDAIPKPRKRRRLAAEHSVGVSPPSNVNDEPLLVSTLPSRRSGRSLKRHSSAIDAIREHKSQSSRQGTPKVALGPMIHKGAPSHIKNHFLDPDAEPCDSDGNSGDEMPASLPGHCHDILLKREEAKRMVQAHHFWIKDHREKKNDHIKAGRKLEWLVSHGKETLDSTKSRMQSEKRLASKWQDRIEGRQEAVSGFRIKEREYDALVKSMDKSFIRFWDAKQKQNEDEMRSQQALHVLQKPQ